MATMYVQPLTHPALPQGELVHVKNDSSAPCTWVFGSQSYAIGAGDTELVNRYLFDHAKRLWGESKTGCPLREIDPAEGSLEYATSQAKQATKEAEAAIAEANRLTEVAKKKQESARQANAAKKALEKEEKPEKK